VQWGRSLPNVPMVMMALGFVSLGTLGFEFARRRDRGIAFLLGALWLVTGIGLVVYMNFKAGFSLFWDQFASIEQHEVRERDYFFVVSFQIWGMFAAFGLVRLVRWFAQVAPARLGIAVASVVTLLPFAANFKAASRRHGPDATVARDFRVQPGAIGGTVWCAVRIRRQRHVPGVVSAGGGRRATRRHARQSLPRQSRLVPEPARVAADQAIRSGARARYLPDTGAPAAAGRSGLTAHAAGHRGDATAAGE